MNRQVAGCSACYESSGLSAGNHLCPVAKHCLDLVISSTSLVLLAPIFAAVAVTVRPDAPGPVCFRQQRVRGGRRPESGSPTKHLHTRFRSMVANAGPRVHYPVSQHHKGDRHRLSVIPWFTGFGQANGPSRLSFFDLDTLPCTIPAIMAGGGIY